MDHKPILITGIARSGTSLVAGIINICGAYGGRTASANRYNAKGMFENSRLRKLVKNYLQGVGADPRGQRPLPSPSDIQTPRDWKERVEQVLMDEGYQGGRWFYKCPKMGLMWKAWHETYPDAQWIVVRRRSVDIVNSCMKTGFMNAFRTQDEWHQWVRDYEHRFAQMQEAGLNMKVVWPERMVKGDYSQVKELLEWLELPWREQEIKNFIEPRLWKARKNERNKR